MEFSTEKKKKISLGREYASYGCSNTFYNSVGQATGIHFLNFHRVILINNVGVTLSNVKMARMDLR